MRLRPTPSLMLTWILAVALTLQPVAAQNPQAPVPTQGEETPNGPPPVVQEAATPVVGEDDSTEGTAITNASPAADPEATFSQVTKNSTPLANPTSAPNPAPPEQSDSPGESKWIILAALITAGAIIGAILLFRGFGGGKSSPKSGPVGTILTPGTPTINPPGQ